MNSDRDHLKQWLQTAQLCTEAGMQAAAAACHTHAIQIAERLIENTNKAAAEGSKRKRKKG